MIAGFEADFVLADKGYDANTLIATMQSDVVKLFSTTQLRGIL